MPNFKFIVNPAAARGKCAKIGEKLESYCKSNGIDFHLEYTKKPGEATSIANCSVKNFECIVAVGGDGTINEVVNGMIDSKIKLGLIPAGCGNDLVRTLKFPNGLSQILDVLFSLKTRLIDIGKAGNTYFHNGLGIGFDAWVVQETLRIQKLRGHFLYFYSILKTIYKYKSPFIQLSYGNSKREERIFMINAGNGIYMGGGLKLTPEAEIDDGLLDINIIEDLTKLEVIQNLLSVYRGTHTQLPQVTTNKIEQMVIESEEGFAMHVDGELISTDEKSLEVSIVPKAIEVIVPN